MLNATLSIQGHHPFLVAAYTYRDELSHPFELEIELVVEDSALDFESLLGSDAEARLGDEPHLGKIRGIVAEVEQLSSHPMGRSHYRVRVIPPVALLAHRFGHRIVQDRSLPDIAKDVIHFSSEKTQTKLSQSHSSREYTVQYNETDLAFAQRLLAEAGVGFFFDHAAQSALTLFDDISAAISTRAQAPYRPLEGQVEERPHIRFVHASARIRPGKVSLDDYDHERPDYDLAGEEVGARLRKAEQNWEQYEVEIGEPKTEGETKRLAKRILESLRVRASTTDVITSFALPAGSELIIMDAPRGDLSQSLVVLASETIVTKVDDRTKTHSKLTVMPKQVPFRPKRIPKPRIYGNQTAFVVGDPGEEIDVDEQGRVKVAFHWDRRGIRQGSPTRRIRVSQAWAGPGYGLMNIPRVGDEVVVSYLDGDPDEPLIVGRVHNTKAPSPLNLPAEKTRSIWKSKSTPGGNGQNHIFLEDKAGNEFVEVFGQRDVHIHSNRNYARSVGQHESRDVGGHSEEDIKSYHKLHVGGPETITIDDNQEVSIAGSQKIAVGPQQTITVGGPQDITTASTTLESGPIDIHGTSVTTHADNVFQVRSAQIRHQADGAHSTLSPVVVTQGTTVTTQATVVSVNAGALAAIASPGSTTIAGGTVLVGAQSALDLGSEGTVVVEGKLVTIVGVAQVQIVGGSTVDISASIVNISGGTTNIN